MSVNHAGQLSIFFQEMIDIGIIEIDTYGDIRIVIDYDSRSARFINKIDTQYYDIVDIDNVWSHRCGVINYIKFFELCGSLSLIYFDIFFMEFIRHDIYRIVSLFDLKELTQFRHY